MTTILKWSSHTAQVYDKYLRSHKIYYKFVPQYLL